MGPRKSRHSRRPKSKAQPEGPALVVVLSTLAITILGYLAGEFIFASRPHPTHWTLAVAGAILGWILGRTYYHFRGDIV